MSYYPPNFPRSETKTPVGLKIDAGQSLDVRQDATTVFGTANGWCGTVDGCPALVTYSGLGAELGWFELGAWRRMHFGRLKDVQKVLHVPKEFWQ